MRAHRIPTLLLLACALAIGGVSTTSLFAQGRVTPDTPRPIDAGASLWAEELTFMEIRDLVKAGTTTIIIGTGGVEQNEPYVAGGKHNFVLATVMPYVARAVRPSCNAAVKCSSACFCHK